MVSCLTLTNRLHLIIWLAGIKLTERKSRYLSTWYKIIVSRYTYTYCGKHEFLLRRDLTYCWVRQSVLYKRAPTIHRSWGKSIGWRFQIAQSTSGDQTYLTSSWDGSLNLWFSFATVHSPFSHRHLRNVGETSMKGMPHAIDMHSGEKKSQGDGKRKKTKDEKVSSQMTNMGAHCWPVINNYGNIIQYNNR